MVNSPGTKWERILFWRHYVYRSWNSKVVGKVSLRHTTYKHFKGTHNWSWRLNGVPELSKYWTTGNLWRLPSIFKFGDFNFLSCCAWISSNGVSFKSNNLQHQLRNWQMGSNMQSMHWKWGPCGNGVHTLHRERNLMGQNDPQVWEAGFSVSYENVRWCKNTTWDRVGKWFSPGR